MCIYILQAVLFRPSGPHQCSADIIYMTLNSANYRPLEVDRLQFFCSRVSNQKILQHRVNDN